MVATETERGTERLYTIKEAAERAGLTTVAVRYYDREGLFPNLRRTEAGYRVFDDDDITFLKVVECLKRSGMSIKDIRQFSEWVREGDASLQQRHDMFQERKRDVERQIAELQGVLTTIEHKCRYYEAALEAGTESIFQGGNTPDAEGRFGCEK